MEVKYLLVAVNSLNIYSGHVKLVKKMWCRCSKSCQVCNLDPKSFMIYSWWLRTKQFEKISTGAVLVKVNQVMRGFPHRGKSQSILFKPVDMVTEFERRPQLQSQILHHHLTFQQEQSVPIYLLKHITELRY